MRRRIIAIVIAASLFSTVTGYAAEQQNRGGLAGLLGNTQQEEQNEASQNEEPENTQENSGSGGLTGLLGNVSSGDDSADPDPETDEEPNQEEQLTAADRKKVTVMLYLCGSNLESEGGAATGDITEILRSKYNTDEVNVLALIGGSSRWQGGFSSKETAIYEISGNRPAKVYGDELLNMGDPDTLTALLDFCHEYYPAESYALDLWDHGGGPMNGVCWDSLANSDNLSMSELVTALDNSFCKEEPLEWIGFDACLMASAETAYLMSPYAKYMIASEETEPGSGWSYSFLNGIENDENGGETGKRIVEKYMEETTSSAQLTLSCIDLSQMDGVLDQMDVFFADLSVELTEETFSLLSNMRSGSRGFGRASSGSQDYDLVDLMDLTEHYAEQNPEDAQALTSAIEKAIVYADTNIEGSNGLSVYHPYYNKALYESGGEQQYASFFFSAGYTQYIRNFASIWLGQEIGDWSRLRAAVQQPIDETEEVQEEEDEMTTFTLELTPDQMETFASAQMLVLQETVYTTSSGFTTVYVSDEVELSEEGVLSAKYGGKTLYGVDENGEPTTGTLHYRIEDGIYKIPAYYSDDFLYNGVSAYLYLEQDKTGEFHVQSIYFYDEVTEQFTNRLEMDLSIYDHIYFLRTEKAITYDGDVLLAYDDWERNGSISAEEIDNTGEELRFRFFDEQLTDEQKYVTFQITDTQANVHSSELQILENENIRDIAFVPEVMEEDAFRLSVKGNLNVSRIYPGITMQFTLENLLEEKTVYEIRSIRLNGERGISDTLFFYPEFGEEEVRSVKLEELDLANLTEITSLDALLYVGSSFNEEREIIPLHMDLTAEEFSFGTVLDEEQMLALDEKDGVVCSISEISQNAQKDLVMTMHWVNDSEEEQEYFLSGAFNDTLFLEGSSGSVVYLPEKSELWTTLVFENGLSSLFAFDHDIKEDGLFGQYGITQIEKIKLYTASSYDTDEDSLPGFELNLETPFLLKDEEVKSKESLLLMDEEGIRIRIYSAEISDNQTEQEIYFQLEVENTNDTDRHVVLGSYRDIPAAVDGIESRLIDWNRDSVIPAGTVSIAYSSLEIPMSSEEEEFFITAGGDEILEEENEEQQPERTLLEFQTMQFDVEVQPEEGGNKVYRITMTLPESHVVNGQSGYDSLALDQIDVSVSEIEGWWS